MIEAVAAGSYLSALRAFTIHPLIGSERIGREILDDLLRTEPALAASLR